VDDLLKAAEEAEKHHPVSDPRMNELLKIITRIGSTAASSDGKKSYLLAQLKCAMIYHGCPITFLTINPGGHHSPIALFYAGEKFDVGSFDPELYSSEDRLKRMVDNPLAVVEYFHSAIIEKVLKGGVFGELTHHLVQ
jgi:Helitron helicase-like domain at N-terminus